MLCCSLSIFFIMPFLFLVDCFLPAAKKYATLCCHSNCVYDVENAQCAGDFGHSVGKCIFIFIFICLTNLWPTLKCPLSLTPSLLTPSFLSLVPLTLCIATALPLIRSLAFSWPLFALKCEIILNILLNIISTCRAAPFRHLPVVSVYESMSSLFILSQPEKENEKSNLLRERTFNEFVVLPAHTN